MIAVGAGAALAIAVAVGIGTGLARDGEAPEPPTPVAVTPTRSDSVAPPGRSTATTATATTGTTPAGPASPTATPTGTTPTRSPSPRPRTPAAAAAALLAEFDALAAAAVRGALVETARLGEEVDTAPPSVVGAWGTGSVGGGRTAAANHPAALRAGALQTTARLPREASTARVRVPGDRKPRTLPVASAYDTFAAMLETDGPPCPRCRPIVVTGAAATTTEVDTTAGRVVVPAWSYAVAGSRARIVRAALPATALVQVADTYRGALTGPTAEAQLPIWQLRSADGGRTISARLDPVLMGARAGCWRLVAAESSSAVALYAARGRATSASPCASASGNVRVTLGAPLASRTVLETYWKRAVPAP